MNPLPVLILFFLFLVMACGRNEKMTENKAIELAKQFAAEQSPELDLSQQSPGVTYFADAPAHGGGELWAVGFSVPASKNKEGGTIGARLYWSYTVWVKADGKTYGGISHSP